MPGGKHIIDTRLSEMGQTAWSAISAAAAPRDPQFGRLTQDLADPSGRGSARPAGRAWALAARALNACSVATRSSEE